MLARKWGEEYRPEKIILGERGGEKDPAKQLLGAFSSVIFEERGSLYRVLSGPSEGTVDLIREIRSGRGR